jgi:hypothetical protein
MSSGLYIVVLLANSIADSFLVYFKVPLSVRVISAITIAL